MTGHPLQLKIMRLRRRVRSLWLIHGMSRVVMVAVSSVAVLVLLDALFRIEDRGLRIMATSALLLAVGWALVRYILTTVFRPLPSVDVALRVERRFPQLNDRLASTIEFLEHAEEDPRFGSQQLRQAVIQRTEEEVDQLDLDQAIAARPVWRSAGVALMICVLATALSLLNPLTTRVALSRLLNPLADQPWPQRSHLEFRDPIRRLALGQEFEVELIDARGRELPEEVWIEYRQKTAAGEFITDQKPMVFAGGVMLARRESVTRPFSYRAYGGDDNSMPWIDVEVVEPPTLSTVSIDLRYPEYTGWPDETGETPLRALVGTEATFRGKTTKPVRSVTLETSYGTSYPATTADDGTSFVIGEGDSPPMLIEQSGTYWFAMEGPQGLVGGRDVAYDLQAIRDLAPSVSIDEPTGDVYVTPEAVVPLKIVAKDDLRLQGITLEFFAIDEDPVDAEVVTLYESGSPTEPPMTSEVELDRQGETRTIEYRWQLASLGLEPGAQRTFYAAATDDQPARGESTKRRLYIVTVEQLEDRLAQRQSVILGELARALEIQRTARQKTSAAKIQSQELGRLTKADLDQLQAAQLSQRQVDRTLRDSTDGVRQQVTTVLQELTNNGLDNPEMTARMEALGAELDRLADQELPAVQQELTAAVKRGQSQLEADAAGQPIDEEERRALEVALAAAGENQAAVIDSLENLLSDLSEWDQFRRLHRELADVRTSQQQLSQRTAELARETLSKPVDELTPQQRADAQKLADAEQELARQFKSLSGQLDQMRDSLSEGDPAAAAAIDDALHHAEERSISGQMNQAAEQLNQNRMAQATAAQRQVARELDEMLDILANRREQQLDRLVQKLKEAESELNQLRQQQDGLRRKLRKASQIEDEEERRRELERLRREQQQLAEDVRRMARRLERLAADQASRSMAQGAGKMDSAGDQAGEDQGSQAADQAQAAKRDLDEAQQQLAKRRRQAEADLAMQQLARIEDSLITLRSRQEHVLEETQRLDRLHQDQGRLARGQLITLADLAREQMAVSEETAEMADRVKAAAAFHLALLMAAEQMQRAAQRLSGRQTDAETQQAEQAAIRRLALLLEALKPGQAQGGKPKEGGGQQPGGSGSGRQQQSGIGDFAQLKLIRLLQEEINVRTAQLDERGAAGQGSETDAEEYTRLSQEQGQLADLVRNLIRAAAEALPEDDPDALPDLDLDQESDSEAAPSELEENDPRLEEVR